MTRQRLRIALADPAALDAQREHLGRGSLLITGLADLVVGSELDLELVNPTGAALVVTAQVVLSGPSGTAFVFRDTSAEAAAAIERWSDAVADAPDDEPDPADAPDDEPTERTALDDRVPPRRAPAGPHERLRGLSLVEQLRVARDGELAERVVLERLYGKAVWEALLRNQRLSHPEVAHLARMGSLPRPQVELIVSNPAWLQSPQVRRALLGNPRLGGDQIDRVLRATPKNELRLMQAQTAYPLAVRSAAKKMMQGGG